MEQRHVIRRFTDHAVVSDFRKFLLKQNIISLAIAVVVGAALQVLVKAFVDSFIMPIVGAAVPSGEWQTFTLGVGPVRFGIGAFLAALLNFLIVGFVAWRLTKMFVAADPPPAATKDCDFCLSKIDPRATRCPHCTSPLATPTTPA
ncbi:MAG TPA: MscL family protein [Gemmatimonadaceae bacterium]|nr:MscL family protein [Gemmatimonadaceae bacterium]